jgi:hypothetical protein
VADPSRFGFKTRISRRTVDLDERTVCQIDGWRRRFRREGLPPHGPDD